MNISAEDTPRPRVSRFLSDLTPAIADIGFCQLDDDSGQPAFRAAQELSLSRGEADLLEQQSFEWARDVLGHALNSKRPLAELSPERQRILALAVVVDQEFSYVPGDGVLEPSLPNEDILDWLNFVIEYYQGAERNLYCDALWRAYTSKERNN